MGRVLLGVLLAATVFVVFAAPYVATHDGPHHLVSCVLSERLTQPDHPAQRYLELGAPLSSQGFQTLCRAAVELAPPFTAYALVLAVLAGLYGLGYAALARALDPDSPVQPLGFAFAFPWVFYMGFFSFFLSLGLGLFATALAVRWDPLRTGSLRLAALGTMLLVGTYAHAFGGAMTGATVALVWLARVDPGQRARALGRALLVGAPALLLFGVVLSTFLAPRPYQGDIELAVVAHQRRPLVDLAETFVGGPPLRAWGLLGFVAICGVVAAAQAPRAPRVHRALLALGGLGLVAALVVPFHVSGWSYFSPRLAAFWPPMLPLAVLWPRRGRAAVWAGGLALAVASLAWSATYHRDVYAAIAPDLAGLDLDVERTQARLPVFLESVPTEVAYVDPAVMLGHLYIVAQGGVDPFIWGEALALDPVNFRGPPEELFGLLPSPYPKVELALAGEGAPPRRAQLDFLTFVGRPFEDVILSTDAADALERFEARGYREVAHAGRVHLLEFEGCPIELAFSGPARLPGPLLVQVGLPGLARPAEQRVLPKGTAWPGGEWTLRWDEAPCGEVWLNVQVGYGVPVEQMLACQEFDGRRRTRLTLAPPGATRPCTLAPARE